MRHMLQILMILRVSVFWQAKDIGPLQKKATIHLTDYNLKEGSYMS